MKESLYSENWCSQHPRRETRRHSRSWNPAQRRPHPGLPCGGASWTGRGQLSLSGASTLRTRGHCRVRCGGRSSPRCRPLQMTLRRTLSCGRSVSVPHTCVTAHRASPQGPGGPALQGQTPSHCPRRNTPVHTPGDNESPCSPLLPDTWCLGSLKGRPPEVFSGQVRVCPHPASCTTNAPQALLRRGGVPASPRPSATSAWLT